MSVQNPQRPYAEHHSGEAETVKRWSDLHGDMQSQAEMTWPTKRHAVASSVTNVSVPILYGRRRFEGSCP